MLSISRGLSADAAPFWKATGYIVGAAVALGVIGETYCHLIPDWTLPATWRSDAARKRIGKWSAFVLAASLVLEIPIQIIKDNISDTAIADLAAATMEIRTAAAGRDIGVSQQTELTAALRQFGGQKFTTLSGAGNAEEQHLLKQIVAALSAAGWVHGDDVLDMAPTAEGLGVGVNVTDRDSGKVPLGAAPLVERLFRFGLMKEKAGFAVPTIPSGQLRIVVGRKPDAP